MDHFSGIDEAHPLLRMTAAVSSLVKDVEDVDPVFMVPGDQAQFLRQVDVLLDRLALLKFGVVREAGDLAAGAGCRSVADWRVAEQRCDAAAARREERLAEALGQRWTATADGVRAGRVSLEKARVITRGLDDLAAALEEEWADTVHEPGSHDGASDSEASADNGYKEDAERSRAWIAEVLERAEAHLIAEAPGLTPTQLGRVAEHLLGVVAPEHAEELERRALDRAERRAREKARLSMRPMGDGTTRLSARLPDAAAQILKDYLHSLSSPRVTQPTGPDTSSTDDASSTGTIFGDPGQQPGRSEGDCDEPSRTVVDPWIDPTTGRRIPQQYRFGQAFVALMERITARHLPQYGGLGASVVVTVDLDSLREGVGHGTIGDPEGEGVDVSIGQVRRLACGSGIIPAVLGSESVVLDLGRTSRLFSMPQRKAHAVHHPTCEADGCTVPAAWCESHHKRDPWAAGGTTNRADLAFLCPWHHHRAHDPTYRVDWTQAGAKFHRRR